MTDETENALDPDEDDLWMLEPFRRNDYMLETLVQVCAGDDERGETAIGITVSLKGQIVTGLLCSYGGWIAALRESKMGSENARVFMEELLNGLEKVPPKRPKGKDVPPRQYFHMKDVTIWQGATQQRLGTFRGRLSEVDGWTFGGLSADA
jgi:hypothetical protein